MLYTGNYVTISTCDTTSGSLSTLSLQYPSGNDTVFVSDTDTTTTSCPNGNPDGAYLNFTVPCSWVDRGVPYVGPDTNPIYRLTTGCVTGFTCTATPILTVVSQARCRAAPPPPPTVPFCGGYQAVNTNDATDITNSQLCPLNVGGTSLIRNATYTIAPSCDPNGVAPPLIGDPLFNILRPDGNFLPPAASRTFSCGSATGLAQYLSVTIPCVYPAGNVTNPYYLMRGCSGNSACTATPNITLVSLGPPCPP